jgi:UV DNA damage repair endonuclease
MSDTWNTVKELKPGSFVVVEAPDGTVVSGYVKALNDKAQTLELLGNDASERKVSFAPAEKKAEK